MAQFKISNICVCVWEGGGGIMILVFCLGCSCFIFFNAIQEIKVILSEKGMKTLRKLKCPISFLQGQVVISLEDQERMRDKEQIRCLRKMLFGPHLNRGNDKQHVIIKLNTILNPSLTNHN